MKLKDILDDTALRGFLNWKYPFSPYHEQIRKMHKDTSKLILTNIIKGNGK